MLKLPGYDLYDSLDLVTRGERSALLDTGARDYLATVRVPFPFEAVTHIYSAPRGQTFETAQLFVSSGLMSRAQHFSLEELSNIKYSFSSLISKQRFLSLPYDNAMAEARRAFVTQLFREHLSITQAELMLRFQKIIELANHPGNHLFIGHAFPMRLFEVWLTNPDCYKDEASLVEAFNPTRRPYEPLSGFSLSRPPC